MTHTPRKPKRFIVVRVDPSTWRISWRGDDGQSVIIRDGVSRNTAISIACALNAVVGMGMK